MNLYVLPQKLKTIVLLIFRKEQAEKKIQNTLSLASLGTVFHSYALVTAAMQWVYPKPGFWVPAVLWRNRLKSV